MSRDPKPTSDEIKEEIDGTISRLIGFVAAAIGLLGLSLAVWATYMVAQLQHPTGGAFAIIGVFLALAVFFLRVGWRLFFNKPNRFGSIFSPRGWRALGAIFAVLAVAMLVVTAQNLAPRIETVIQQVVPVVGAFVFSYWCFKSGTRAETNASSKSAL